MRTSSVYVDGRRCGRRLCMWTSSVYVDVVLVFERRPCMWMVVDVNIVRVCGRV